MDFCQKPIVSVQRKRKRPYRIKSNEKIHGKIVVVRIPVITVWLELFRNLSYPLPRGRGYVLTVKHG